MSNTLHHHQQDPPVIQAKHFAGPGICGFSGYIIRKCCNDTNQILGAATLLYHSNSAELLSSKIATEFNVLGEAWHSLVFMLEKEICTALSQEKEV